jgi:uncharacterized membrane protein
LRVGIEWVAQTIEVLAVAVMVTFILVGTLRWLSGAPRRIEAHYQTHRSTLGKSLLVGLEVLVAADIIRTVTLDATLASIVALGALVVVRAALSCTVTVEVEGCWPWQPERRRQRNPRNEAGSIDSQNAD